MKSKIFSPKSQRAFTMIELLLAVFVLEIGLLGVAGFYFYSLQITKTARNETIASNLAAGFLDEELAQNFDNLVVGPPGNPTDLESPFNNFQKQIDIAYIDSATLTPSYTQTEANQYMKKITVTVFWPYETGERSFQIATIKAKH